MRVRIGNDFFTVMEVRENNELVDLISVKPTVELFCRVGMKLFKVPRELFTVLPNGLIRIEVKAEVFTMLGEHKFIAKYWHYDTSMSDDDRKREVDAKLFHLVDETQKADPLDDTPIVANIITGLKGDPFTYDDFTPEQIEELKRPAIEGGEYAREQGVITKQIGINVGIAEADREINENLRIQNETDRINTFNSIKNDAVSVTESANNSASNANEKANFAQAQGDYAKTQGDRLEELSNNWIKNW